MAGYKDYVLEFKLGDGTMHSISFRIPLGENGGYYTPEINQISETEIEISYVPSMADMPTIKPAAIKIPSSGGNVDLTGYATEQYVKDYAQPKGNYLTEHQSLEGYAKTADIPTEPEDIGAQPEGDYALRSEIPSVPVKSVNGKTGAVSLTASDVKARPDSWMPTASEVGALPSSTVIPTVPTKVSEFTNDAGYLTEHQDLSEYAKKTEIPAVPVKSVNGKTGAVSLTASDVKARPDTWMPSASDVGALPSTTVIPTVPTKLSAFTNDSGFITGYTETDPTVPAWAKASSKPSYSKSEVGLGNVENVKQYSASNPPPYPVTSVNGQTGAVTIEADKFDPTVYGLPVLHLTGDTTGMSKDNEVTLDWTYGENSGSCTLKWQGSSSIAYDKKNYTIKLDSAIDVGWGSQKKYCLKANYIDHTHARNIVSAKLWGQMVASRSGVHSTLKTCPNYGAVDGFPIAIMLNGEFHGLYTWNIPKDKWTFNLGSGTQEAVICADVDSPAVDLRVHSTVTEKVDHALEEVTDEDNAGWVATSLNNLIDRCVNSYGADLDTTIAQYMDWNSAIDYLILTVLIDGRDMYKKNYIMVTYDGTKWIWSAYDMDSTYGLQWAGKETLRADEGISFVKFRVNRVMELIYRFKTNALKTRYEALRSSVLSEENISVMFENFVHGIPSTLYDADIRKWPSVPGSSVVTVEQILRWLHRRLAVADKWIDELPTQETPVAPTAREGNVVASSIDSTGAVYNGTGYKSGYTIEIEDGVESEVAAEGCCITGYIPVTKNNVIKVTTDSWNASPEDSRIIFYDMEKKPMAFYTQPGYVGIFNEYTDATSIKWKQYQSVTYGADGMTTLNIAYGANCTNLGYIRIRGVGKGSNLCVIREGEVPDHAIEPETPAYTNQVPLSIDADGSVFNGTGYQDGLRLSSSGTTKASEWSTVTGFIPAKAGDVIRIVGVEWYSDTANYVCTYDSSFNPLTNFYGDFKTSSANNVFDSSGCSVLNSTDAVIKIGPADFSSISGQIAYIRVSSQGLPASRNEGIKQTGANMIVTVNEEIT